MTTKPKARKFRIKRGGPALGGQSALPGAPEGEAGAPMPDAFDTVRAPDAAAPSGREALRARIDRPEPAGDGPQPAARTGDVASATQVAGETDIDAIKREGLTGRQLRMARRVAQKHGLAPTSDLDAVRLLRQKGIDPFQRGTMLELVVPEGEEPKGKVPAKADAGRSRVQLPQTIKPEQVPATDVNPAQRRAQEIADIQRDIGRRRRKRSALLLVRLAFFVLLPTTLAGYYFYSVATPMYATHSAFSIITNEGSSAPGGFGGLLPSQFATSQDAIIVQDFLTSRDAMLRLNADMGFKDHFSQERIDPIQRLDPEPTNEEAYKIYKKNVKLGYDPTEGVMRMEVAAADPATSAAFSKQLIGYAEERVNSLSQQKREDGMRDARESLERAQAERRETQEALVRLQIEGQTLDPEGVIGALRGQITEIEGLMIEKEIELASLLNNARPNTSRVSAVRGDLEVLQQQLDKLNARMIDVSQGENSLAELAVRLQMAQADLAGRDMNVQSALTGLEAARAEANKQVRYLVVGVQPVEPDEAAYPRAFENTILAFLIFGGIYLMVSLTASILREQVSS
ncbi:MAG: capsule biosynthesis protein [Pseudomonadota bacterium]